MSRGSSLRSAGGQMSTPNLPQKEEASTRRSEQPFGGSARACATTSRIVRLSIATYIAACLMIVFIFLEQRSVCPQFAGHSLTIRL